MDSRREMIAAVIRDAITAGKYAPGDRVPTEEALAREHRVNRGTVHDAYGDLENEGIVGPGNGRAGRRVTVRDSMIVHVCRTESRERAAERATAGADAWTADVRDLGREPGQQLTLALEPATAAMAARLGLEPGAPVVIRRHVRTVDGEPSNLSDTYYDRELVKDTEIMLPVDIPEGVIAYMRDKMDIHQVRFTVELGARMPTPDEARQLRIPPGVPMLTEHRVGYDEKDRPVKVTVTIWPAHKVRLLCEFPG